MFTSKVFRVQLLLLCLVACVPALRAEVYKSGKFTYQLYTNTASVIDYDGELPSTLTIPATVSANGKELRVTGIGYNAGLCDFDKIPFCGSTTLKKVVLPASVTKMDYGVFCNCPNLKEFDGGIAADSSKEGFYRAGNWIIHRDSDGWLRIQAYLPALGYPEDGNVQVTKSAIPFPAADSQNKTQSIYIRPLTFYGASGIKKITLGANFRIYNGFSLGGAFNVESVSVNSASETLRVDSRGMVVDKNDSQKLYFCPPGKGANLDAGANYNWFMAGACWGAKIQKFDIRLFPSLTYVAQGCFMESALESVYWASDGTSSGTVGHEEGLGMFEYCLSLSDVTIGGDISRRMFLGCPAISSISLPTTLQIGEAAFKYSGVKSINLPMIQTIGEEAFAFSSLEKVTNDNREELFTPTLQSIGSNAFYRASLKTVGASVYATQTITVGQGAFAAQKSEQPCFYIPRDIKFTDNNIDNWFVTASASDYTEPVFFTVNSSIRPSRWNKLFTLENLDSYYASLAPASSAPENMVTVTCDFMDNHVKLTRSQNPMCNVSDFSHVRVDGVQVIPDYPGTGSETGVYMFDGNLLDRMLHFNFTVNGQSMTGDLQLSALMSGIDDSIQSETDWIVKNGEATFADACDYAVYSADGRMMAKGHSNHISLFKGINIVVTSTGTRRIIR